VIYLDTSVLTAYYTVEEHSERATEIVTTAEEPMVSDLAIAEFNATIWRKQHQGFLTPESVAAVFALFDEHVQNVYRRVPISPAHVESVRDLAGRCPVLLRTLDALHLVLAISQSVAELATFDRRLADAAKATGFAVLS